MIFKEDGWKKSKRSGSNGGDCVEVQMADGVVGIRDSKNKQGLVLTVSPAAFAAFRSDIKKGLI
ncbi:DUF397 domain-containing protein [Streptosporangium sp. NPDC023825]|uniref:DUF397 domain-containing protein n=1 Tax=Streptosporangium sp. NPDC023825 TaxID=3154909 RepID=UPI0034189E86